MELRPEHRYASAAAMAADLRAFLAGRVTAARPQGPLGRLRKWVRREPWRAAAVVMFVLGAPLLGALAGQWWANRPLVHAAEASARAALVEHALADAYLAAAGGETEHARTELARALALAPAHAEALAVRDLLATPAAPAPPPAAGDEPEPIVAAMHHLLAAPSISRTAHDRLDVATARRVLPVISLASRLAPAPRLPVYVLLGSLAAAANSKPHARDAADVLAQRWPDVPAAQRARARALRAVDVKASIELLRRYVAANPRDASLRFDLVAALCVAGDKEGAIEESRLLPELAPNDPMAHICLAEHFAKAGRAPEAVPSYRRALALDPNNPITNYNLGFALGEAGQLEESLTYLRRATELKPDHAQAWVNISATLFELGRGSEGRAAVDAAVAAAPDLPQAHANRRKLALETRDWPLLWQELTRWVGRQPHYVEGHREVAEFLLCRDVAAPYGSAADALGAALRAFALSQWTDAEAAELGARAWRLLGNPMAAKVMAQMVVPVTADARR
jgi:tetratricopeptide (TPR) repeat protein